MDSNGVQRTVTESYLVDALSFTEAEARIVEEMKAFISGEFTVSGIVRKKFAETFLDENGDRYYNARLAFIMMEEKSGAEKRQMVNFLVQASSVKEAVENVEAGMKGTMCDYEIVSVTETAIIDLFPYNNKKATE